MRHLTSEELQAEQAQLNAAARAAHPPWMGPQPDARTVDVPLDEPHRPDGFAELASHAGTSIRLGQLIATTDGFGFTLMLAGPVWDVPPIMSPLGSASPGRPTGPEVVQIELAFADGTTASNVNGQGYGYDISQPPDGRVVSVGSQGSGTGGNYSSAHGAVWSWPLPPPGPFVVRVAWPLRDLEGALELSGDAILAALARPEETPDFALAASWVRDGFILVQSGRGGVTVAHHAVVALDDPNPPPVRPPPQVVFSAAWMGPPQVLAEGRMDMPRISIVATRSAQPDGYRGVPSEAVPEQLGERLLSIANHGGETLIAYWREGDVDLVASARGITPDGFRKFIAGLTGPDLPS